MNFNLLAYRNCANLGNTIQTYGLSHVINPSRGVWYDDIRNRPGEILVCNGWFQSTYQKIDKSTRAVFAGIHLTDLGGFDISKTVEWMRESNEVIGTRDPGTAQYLQSIGIQSEFIGCASLMIPRYDGPRTGGILYVDSDCRTSDGFQTLSHSFPASLPWQQKWELVQKTISLYRTAKCVYTTRLHVALPCIAMGTPVLINSNVDKRRFSILDYMGLKYDNFFEADVGKIRETFVEFLKHRLGRDFTPSDPVMPTVEEIPSASIQS